MNDNVRVSFVMATYNGGLFVEDQVNSLLSIIGERDEIVISDDCSSDNTLNVLSGILDHRIRLFSFNERLGYQRNFERAIFHARGKYIFFADQDDICLPNRVSLSLDELDKCGCVFGDATVVNRELITISDSFFSLRGVSKFSTLHLFLKPSAIGATMGCTSEFLRSSLPFPKGVPHDQWLSMLASFRSELRVVREPIILYRRHDATASLTGKVGKRPLSKVLTERFILFYSIVIWLINDLVGRLFSRKLH